MEDKNTQYVKEQLAAGKLPTEIVGQLTAAGWQETQAVGLVQQVSGVQLATASPGGYSKPPIILQVLFALYIFVGFIGLIAVISGVNALMKSNELGGLGTLAGIVATSVGVVLLLAFFMVYKMRSGSLLALKIYTILAVLTAAGSFYDLADSNAIETDPTGLIIAQAVLPILIAVYLWVRHRAYFR